jgi:steroid delta-isomerase
MNSKQVDSLILWYEKLNQSNLNQIYDFYAKDAYFRDPFHEYFELESLVKLYEEMFKKIKNPRFIITNSFFHDEELVLFWDFKFMAFGKEMTIAGNTLFKFNTEGKVCYHLDYWDSVHELWMNIPIIGQMIKLFYKIVF